MKIKPMNMCYMWCYNNKQKTKKEKFEARKWRTDPPSYFAGLGKISFTCHLCTPADSPAEKY